MKKPVFPHANTIYTISWILIVPVLIDISTACTLFSFWLVWLLFFLVLFLSLIRLWHGFAQKCYKFCGSLLAQLMLVAAILGFFQLSFNNVIHTPLSHSVAPDIVEIADPVLVADSMENKTGHKDDGKALDKDSEKTDVKTDYKREEKEATHSYDNLKHAEHR